MAKVVSAKAAPTFSAQKPKTAVTKPNIIYAKPLYYISLCTGMSCPIDLDNYRAESGIKYKIYCVLMVLIIIGATVSDFLGRMRTSYTFLVQTIKITDMMQQGILLITNVYAIMNFLFFGEKYVKSYFVMMKQIDENLITTMNLKRKCTQFYTLLIITHLVMILLCVYDGCTWVLMLGINVWRHYAFRLYAYYLNIVIVLQIYTFSQAVRLRFKILNERLFDISTKWAGSMHSNRAIAIRDLFYSYKKSTISVEASGLTLNCLVRMHDLLCDLTDLLNSAYGFNVVLLVCNIIVNSVIALNLTLVFGSRVQSANDSSPIHLIALNIFWAIFFLTMGVFVAKSCDACSKEGCRTATICYKFLACTPIESHIASEREIRIELTQLAMQVDHRRPAFDACGFFPINNSMLYAIIGAISSYIVIIIQFNNSQFETIGDPANVTTTYITELNKTHN